MAISTQILKGIHPGLFQEKNLLYTPAHAIVTIQGWT